MTNDGVEFFASAKGDVYPSIFGLKTFTEPADYSSKEKPEMERVVGHAAEPIEDGAEADIPDAYRDERTGRFYYDKPVVASDFRMNPASEKAYRNIQDIARSTLGRDMDHEVAVIRAKMQSGEFSREQARETAWRLRERRDIERAERVAARLTSDMANEGRWKPGDRGVTWRDVYVPTTPEMLARRKANGWLNAVRDEINDVVTNRINLVDEETRERMLHRAAYLADRVGLQPEYADETYDDKVDLRYDPEQDYLTAKDVLASAMSDFDELEAAARKNGMRRFYGDRGYPEELANLRNFINYLGNKEFRSRWDGPAPRANYTIKRTRRTRTGRYL